ncbi:hypothetical protein CWB98_19425, partial [Pseudoalteromonas rubra]
INSQLQNRAEIGRALSLQNTTLNVWTDCLATLMYNDRLAIYRFHARLICGADPMPILLVDWADTAVDDFACFRQHSGTLNDSV